MKYKKYFKDSINIAEIGLGAWQLGQNSGWKSMTETEVVQFINIIFKYSMVDIYLLRIW